MILTYLGCFLANVGQSSEQSGAKHVPNVLNVPHVPNVPNTNIVPGQQRGPEALGFDSSGRGYLKFANC